MARLYGSQGDPATWVDFRPEESPYGTPPRRGRMEQLDVALVSGTSRLDGDLAGRRSVEVFIGPLRLLPVYWAYDERTCTLFTADAFTHVWRADASGRWVAVEDEAPPTVEAVYEHMTRSRYWWLAGAYTHPIREELAEVFATRDVATVAPSFGCILRGRDVVRRHHELLQDALELASRRPSIGIEAGRWTA